MFSRVSNQNARVFKKSNQNAWVGNAQALADPRKKAHPWDGNAIAPKFQKQKREHFRHIRYSQRHRCHNTRRCIGQVPYSVQPPHPYIRCTPRLSRSNLFFPKEKTKIITTRKIGAYTVGQSGGESHPIEKSPWCHQEETFFLVEAVRRRTPVGWRRHFLTKSNLSLEPDAFSYLFLKFHSTLSPRGLVLCWSLAPISPNLLPLPSPTPLPTTQRGFHKTYLRHNAEIRP